MEVLLAIGLIYGLFSAFIHHVPAKKRQSFLYPATALSSFKVNAGQKDGFLGTLQKYAYETDSKHNLRPTNRCLITSIAGCLRIACRTAC